MQSNLRQAKAAMRVKAKELISSISEISRKNQSANIAKKLLIHERFRTAKSLSIYLSTKDEVDTISILEQVFINDKICYIPMYSNQMDMLKMVRLYSIDDYNLLPSTKWDIKQPKDMYLKQTVDGKSQMIQREQLDPKSTELDLIVVPGLAFTRDRLRLGHGRGYYDKYLNCLFASLNDMNKKLPYTTGLAFEEQIFSSLPAGDEDFVLDEIITSN